MTHAVMTFRDASKEDVNMLIHLPDIAADGSNWAAILALIDSARTQLEALLVGNLVRYTITADIVRVTNVTPSDNSARESAWLVNYQDDVTLKVHTAKLAPADRSLMPMNAASDFVDTNDTVNALWVAFLAWFNADYLSPDGNGCTLLTMEHVGRNS